ncbi:hypothetical protein BH10BAC5_BH10BAC5_01640 [soil metagenome]
MKLNKFIINLLAPTILSLFLYSVLVSLTSYDLNNSSEFRKDSIPNAGNDSVDPGDPQPELTEPQNINPNDLSSAFNESGYMKSNSVSMDGKEMINDFNGNLIYQIPMGKGKKEGELYYDLNLTYNGNINYQLITSNKITQVWESIPNG